MKEVLVMRRGVIDFFMGLVLWMWWKHGGWFGHNRKELHRKAVKGSGVVLGC